MSVSRQPGWYLARGSLGYYPTLGKTALQRSEYQPLWGR